MDFVVAGQQGPRVFLVVEDGEVERREREGDGFGFARAKVDFVESDETIKGFVGGGW